MSQSSIDILYLFISFSEGFCNSNNNQLLNTFHKWDNIVTNNQAITFTYKSILHSSFLIGTGLAYIAQLRDWIGVSMSK